MESTLYGDVIEIEDAPFRIECIEYPCLNWFPEDDPYSHGEPCYNVVPFWATYCPECVANGDEN